MVTFEIISAEEAAAVTNRRPASEWDDLAEKLVNEVAVNDAVRVRFESRGDAERAKRSIRAAVNNAGFVYDRSYVSNSIVEPKEGDADQTVVLVVQKVQGFRTFEEHTRHLTERAARRQAAAEATTEEAEDESDS